MCVSALPGGSRIALRLWIVVGILLVLPLGTSCQGTSAQAPDGTLAQNPDGYVALVPRVLRSGELATFSVSLLQDGRPAAGDVQVAVLRQSQTVARGSARVEGTGSVDVALPPLDPGEYEVVVNGPGFEKKTDVQVQDGTLLFVETDKPIYKPGQTMLMRVVALDSELMPVAAAVTVEVQDAKGVKVFKKDVGTDTYGTATLELPLSVEPNLGVWKIRARAGETQTEVDVRVEEYVLPKYGLEVELSQDWFLVDEPLTGYVAAEYSFGKPVEGELRVTATRYVGVWEEFASYSGHIDGEGEFRVDAVGYVAGVPEAGGQGNVQLDVTVVEKATGYEETTSQLVTVAAAPVTVKLIPESQVFKPSLPYSVLVVTETPAGEPLEAAVTVDVTYLDEGFVEVGRESRQLHTSRGLALLRLEPAAEAAVVNLEARSGDAAAAKQLAAAYSPSDSFVHVEQIGVVDGPLAVGATARFRVSATAVARTFYYEVVVRDRVVFTGTADAGAVGSGPGRPNGGGAGALGDAESSAEIAFAVTPAMAPSAKLLVYQILPTTEVAADVVPFAVTGEYPQTVEASFDGEEVRPGDRVTLDLRTEGPSKVGLVAVDRSVFILAENRLNLQQVFAELERLYMQPRAELHEVDPGPEPGPLGGPMPIDGGPVMGGGDVMIEPGFGGAFGGGGFPTSLPGALDTFRDAGMIVLSNQKVPEGKDLTVAQAGGGEGFFARVGEALFGQDEMAMDAATATTAAAAMAMPTEARAGLAEVQRVRQFFPETWIWEETLTDDNGEASLEFEIPDSITTWDLRAVALSPEKGFGVAEASLRAFQPFFLSVDLPYSCIRGEEFPVSVAVYNYLDEPQDVLVEIESADWFELVPGAPGAASRASARQRAVSIPAGDIGSAEFTIRPTALGNGLVKVSARTAHTADAVLKSVIVEPEGVPQEAVQNAVLAAGDSLTLDLSLPSPGPLADSAPGVEPQPVVPGSARAYVALSGSLLAQTIDGLDQLLQMPFGCGEQNMILFAPDTYILRYLKDTGQLKPEIQATAEALLVTGYQRELTYRRGDGSFSAFGDQDPEGSLFLTAFVMKTFAQASDLVYIDDAVLAEAAAWIEQHQRSDGSFESVGFVHHTELLGGVQGTDALTAYAAVALLEAGQTAAADRALDFLEGRLGTIEDPYALALTAYALTLGDSDRAPEARGLLMAAASEDEDGLYWGQGPDRPVPMGGADAAPMPGAAEPAFGGVESGPSQSTVIEATGYATLVLTASGDLADASRAARWLVAHRNSLGGFGSTQDTVVALQALSEYAAVSAADSDVVVTVSAGDRRQEVRIDSATFDVTQIVEVPAGVPARLEAVGDGQAVVQGVLRYNVPESPVVDPVFDLTVDYDSTQVEVDDIVDVRASVTFDPPEPLLGGTGSVKAGMVVLDVSVPTGFEPVEESLEALRQVPKVKRYDVAGRKVIVYIEDMDPGERIDLGFQVQARYPVKGKGGVSQVYAYYTPEWQGTTVDPAVIVR